MKRTESYMYWTLIGMGMFLYTIIKNLGSLFLKNMDPMSIEETSIVLAIITILLLTTFFHWFFLTYRIELFFDMRLKKKNIEPPVEEYKNKVV